MSQIVKCYVQEMFFLEKKNVTSFVRDIANKKRISDCGGLLTTKDEDMHFLDAEAYSTTNPNLVLFHRVLFYFGDFCLRSRYPEHMKYIIWLIDYDRYQLHL